MEPQNRACFRPGSNRRPCACEAHVITTTLRKLLTYSELKHLTVSDKLVTTSFVIICRITLQNIIQIVMVTRQCFRAWHTIFPFKAVSTILSPDISIFSSILLMQHCVTPKGLVAQRITRLTTNQKIAGSNPAKVDKAFGKIENSYIILLQSAVKD